VRSIFKGGFQLSSARGVVLAIQALQYFILAKLLAPTGFGQVSLFSIVLLYTGLTGFGIDTVAAREIPGRVAGNDRERVDHLTDLAFTCELVLRAVVALGVALVGVIFYEGTIRVGLILIAAVLFFDRIQALYYGIGSALKRFDVLSRANILGGVIIGVFTVLLVQTTGVYTQLIATLACALLTTVYYHRRLGLRPRLRFDIGEFLKLVRMGLPFVALAIVFYLWKASDRTVIAAFTDFKSLGMYAFAAACVQLVMAFMNDFQTALQPAVYERTARAQRPEDFYGIVRRPSILLAYLTPALVAFLWLAYPVVVALLLPEYSGTIWVFRILALQIFLMNIGVMVAYLLRSAEINRQSYLVWLYVIAAGLSYALSVALLASGFGLVGVAVGNVIAHGIAVVMTFVVAQRYFLVDRRQAFAYYRELIEPLPLLLLFCVMVYWLEQRVGGGVIERLVLQSGLFLGFSGLVVYRMSVRLGMAATTDWYELFRRHST
jgi:O-antigen/teichoic acid export membrane protein